MIVFTLFIIFKSSSQVFIKGHWTQNDFWYGHFRKAM